MEPLPHPLLEPKSLLFDRKVSTPKQKQRTPTNVVSNQWETHQNQKKQFFKTMEPLPPPLFEPKSYLLLIKTWCPHGKTDKQNNTNWVKPTENKQSKQTKRLVQNYGASAAPPLLKPKSCLCWSKVCLPKKNQQNTHNNKHVKKPVGKAQRYLNKCTFSKLWSLCRPHQT